MAGPRKAGRVGHHARAHRIELDVAIAGHYVSAGLGNAGTEAAFPKRAGPIVPPVEIQDIGSAEVAHQQPTSLRTRRGDQEMHVVRHEAVSMHLALVLHRELPQGAEVSQVVAVMRKARVAVVSALNDVQRHIRKTSRATLAIPGKRLGGAWVDRAIAHLTPNYCLG